MVGKEVFKHAVEKLSFHSYKALEACQIKQ